MGRGFFGFITRLRTRPLRERRIFGTVLYLVCAGLVVVLWVSSIQRNLIAPVMPNGEDAGGPAAPQKLTPELTSPLQVLTQGFADIRSGLDQIFKSGSDSTSGDEQEATSSSLSTQAQNATEDGMAGDSVQATTTPGNIPPTQQKNLRLHFIYPSRAQIITAPVALEVTLNAADIPLSNTTTAALAATLRTLPMQPPPKNFLNQIERVLLAGGERVSSIGQNIFNYFSR